VVAPPRALPPSRAVDPVIRPFAEADLAPLVDLSLRAWAPVFASIERQLAGSGVFELQHPDWRADRRAAVESAGRDTDVLVAEVDGAVAGFVATTRREDDLGEIHMIAVDPDHQRRGAGRALTRAALERLRARRVATAMVETGGDPGHEPARRLYEDAGFTALPIVRYFTTL
jgi:ribosomal protein S18 acetylase RimI-like enzyme